MEQEHVIAAPVQGLTASLAISVRGSNRSWRELHNTYTLCAVLPPTEGASSGSIRYRNWTYDVQPGQVLLMEPGEVHVTRKLEGTANFCMLQVHSDGLDDLLGADWNEPWHWAAAYSTSSALHAAVVGAVQHACHAAPDWLQQEAVRRALCIAVDCHSERYRSPAEPSASPAELSRTQGSPLGLRRAELHDAASRLATNPQSRQTLEELADHVGLTRYRLVQLFSESFGVPPMQYRLQYRLLEARKRLQAGASVADAAHASGFYDQAQFCKQFKKDRGMTPSRYQKSVAALGAGGAGGAGGVRPNTYRP